MPCEAHRHTNSSPDERLTTADAVDEEGDEDEGDDEGPGARDAGDLSRAVARPGAECQSRIEHNQCRIENNAKKTSGGMRVIG